MRSNPNVQKFKTKEEAVKSYMQLQTLVSHDKVAIPKDEKDLVAIENFNNAMGIPNTPEGYELEDPEPIPGLESVQFGMDEFKQVVHKHGLTPKQADGLKNDYQAMLAEMHKNAVTEYQSSVEAAKEALTQEWGVTYNQKVELAQSVMNKFAGDKESFDHINALIGADPVALKWLATIGENFTEGSLGNLGTPSPSFTKTPSEASKEYEAIMADPEDIYWAGVRNNKPVSETARKERVSYVEGLLRMAQPGGKA
jgi:hypothetical protein